jgi:hypothetical protein
MKKRVGVSKLGWCACVLIGVLVASPIGGAQERKTTSEAPVADPRVGLKPGLEDAGVASRNMELIGHVSKPPAFVDPSGAFSLDYANSDLAFGGDHLFVGNFQGLNFYSIEDPKRPSLLASVLCPGGQGDVSVHGNLLFMSVEQTRGRLDCGAQGVSGAVSAERFRGIRIFDISRIDAPRQVAAVQTCKGSHTHTLVIDPKDTANVYIYASGTSSVRSADELAGCSRLDPKDDPNTALFSIDVIQVPLGAPETARIVNRPRIFADAATGAIAGLWPGGTHGEGTQTTSATNQCHDITVYPEKGLAAGACAGNGILLDISDPVRPVRLDAVIDSSFAYWHSATFNNDGSKVIFTDEWGGGTQPRCRPTDQLTWGADAIFDIVDRKLQFRGYYKMPAPQTDVENCVAHNGSIVPVPGRDIMAQAWYQGGVSVFDFTDSAHPVEIAFFDRGPIDAKLVTAGFWATYWYNGHIYGSEMGRGVDVFRLTPSQYLSQSEIDAATLVHVTEFNAQHQPRMNWPPSFVVARAYVDQLARDIAISGDRAEDVKRTLDRVERLPSGQARSAGVAELDELATGFERDANSAAGVDASRLRALATTIRALR